MGLKSRNKGKAGEREITALIHDLTGWNVRRRVRQHEGDADFESATAPVRAGQEQKQRFTT